MYDIYLSIYLFIYPFIYLSIYLYVCIYILHGCREYARARSSVSVRVQARCLLLPLQSVTLGYALCACELVPARVRHPLQSVTLPNTCHRMIDFLRRSVG